MLKEFRAFILRGNVVDLAVGVVIGAAFSAIVNGLVTGLLNPLIAVFGDTGLRDLSFTFGTRTIDGPLEGAVDLRVVPNAFQYGLMLDAIVQFVLIAAAVFFGVVKPLNHLMARVRSEPIDPTTRACPECLGDIPMAATRCRHCAVSVSAP